MNSISMKAYAKINLTLDVLGKRPDGYHEIDSIFQTVSLFDEVTIEKQETEGIFCRMDNFGIGNPDIPEDEKNIAVKAAKSMFRKFNLPGGLSIRIQKGIPTEAGLGGGSADAAAVIQGIRELFSIGVSDEEMIDFAKNIGADIPFLLFGGTKRVSGIGEKITNLPSLPELPMVLIKPKIGMKTKEIYDAVDQMPKSSQVTGEVARFLEAGAGSARTFLGFCAPLLKNDLSKPVFDRFPAISELRCELLHQNAETAFMSGSGSSVIGLFETEEKARDTVKKMTEQYPDCFCRFLKPTQQSLAGFNRGGK